MSLKPSRTALYHSLAHIEVSRERSAGHGPRRRATVRGRSDVTKGVVQIARLAASQIQLIDMIINHLTEREVIDPELLYERPFTDVSDQGLSGIFPSHGDRQTDPGDCGGIGSLALWAESGGSWLRPHRSPAARSSRRTLHP